MNPAPHDRGGRHRRKRFDAVGGAGLKKEVNPFSTVTWSWRALRGHSVTFAVLFACGLLGISIMSLVRDGLSRLGAPWYIWFVAPIILVTVLAKKELQWLPDLEQRKKWARRIFFGAIVLSFVMAFFTPAPPPPPGGPVAPKPGTFHKVPR